MGNAGGGWWVVERWRIQRGEGCRRTSPMVMVVVVAAVMLLAAILPGMFAPVRGAVSTLPDFGPGTSWVSYGHAFPQPSAVTAADIALLKDYGATGIVTYTSLPGYDDAATVASLLGMKVIIGINDPTSLAETAAAVAIAKAFPSTVQGVVVGNEGLCWSHYSFDSLASAMTSLRQQLGSSVALSTAEPLQVYQAAYYRSTSYDINCNPGIFAALLSLGDYISANIQAPGCNAASGARWVWSQMSWIQSVSGKVVIGHEIDQLSDWGWLSPLQTVRWCSESDQRDFFCSLRALTNGFSHFTAFDETGGDAVMAYGGLFTTTRSPKPAALALRSC